MKAYRLLDIENNKIIFSRDVVFNETIHTGFLAVSNENYDEVPLSPESEPQTLEEALASPEGPKWREAVNEEYKSLLENKTWTLDKLPTNRQAIGCKWIFRKKRDVAGSLDRYKARLVVQGFRQKYQIDYSETFAPVVEIYNNKITCCHCFQPKPSHSPNGC